MILPPDAKITTDLLWRGALLFAGLDIIMVSVLVWRVRPAAFRQLRGELIATTALFWCGLWFWAVGYFWDSVYQYVFPAWSRWLIPFFQAALTVLAAALAWYFSGRLRLHPILSYSLTGGLWGMLSHLWAVALGIVDKPPLLEGAAPIAAIVVAIFEFTFYWCVIIVGALLVRMHVIPRYAEPRVFAGLTFDDPDYPSHYAVPARRRYLSRDQFTALAARLRRLFTQAPTDG